MPKVRSKIELWLFALTTVSAGAFFGAQKWVERWSPHLPDPTHPFRVKTDAAVVYVDHSAILLLRSLGWLWVALLGGHYRSVSWRCRR